MLNGLALTADGETVAVSKGWRIMRVIPQDDPRFPLLAIVDCDEYPVVLISPERRLLPQLNPESYSRVLLDDCRKRPMEAQELRRLLDEHCGEEPL